MVQLAKCLCIISLSHAHLYRSCFVVGLNKLNGCRYVFFGIPKQTLLINFPRSLSLFPSIFLFDYISQQQQQQQHQLNQNPMCCQCNLAIGSNIISLLVCGGLYDHLMVGGLRMLLRRYCAAVQMWLCYFIYSIYICKLQHAYPTFTELWIVFFFFLVCACVWCADEQEMRRMNSLDRGFGTWMVKLPKSVQLQMQTNEKKKHQFCNCV